MKTAPPKILFYDIETTPLEFKGFSLGKQFVRHNSLNNNLWNRYHIICIAYKFSDKKRVESIVWDPSKDESHVIEDFDSIISQARNDGYVVICIGKNSDRFDVKHINTQRWMHGLDPIDWTVNSDDVEKQLRKHFYLPSYSLDYVAKLRLGSGKNKMDFSDWVDICNGIDYKNLSRGSGLKKRQLDNISLYLFGTLGNIILKKHKKALDKMVKYNKKDVEDTARLWDDILPHITPKYNQHAHNKMIGSDGLHCVKCGETHLTKNGTSAIAKTVYQRLKCGSCGHNNKFPINSKDIIEYNRKLDLEE